MEYELDYDTAVSRGRLQVGSLSGYMWSLGDIATRVQPVYGDATIQRLADDIGLEHGTLYEYRRVARAYPQQDRSGDLSWTVHAVFAAEPDRAELVQRAWTVREAKAERDRRRARDAEPGPQPEPESRPVPVPVPVPAKPALRGRGRYREEVAAHYAAAIAELAVVAGAVEADPGLLEGGNFTATVRYREDIGALNVRVTNALAAFSAQGTDAIAIRQPG